MIFRVLLSLIHILCITSCAMLPMNRFPAIFLKGHITHGRYYDSQGFFSVAIPEMTSNMRIEEIANEERIAGVIMYDDVGSLLRVETIDLPDKEYVALAEEFKNPQEQLKWLFEIFVLPTLDQFCNYQLVGQKKMDLPDPIGPAYFVVFHLQEGSSLISSQTQKRLNTLRGYLVTFSGSQIVFICTQLNYLDYDLLEYGFFPPEQQIEEMFNQLAQSRKSYRNEKESKFCTE